MDVDERIVRRRRAAQGTGLVTEWRALDPTAHVENPVGRGATLEQVLDALEPAFEASVPPDAYVYGPPGSGKSAVISVLFERLTVRFDNRDTIGTTTRSVSNGNVAFVYADARRCATPFRLYVAIGNAIVPNGVPERGVGMDAIRERVASATKTRDAVVVAVDHVAELGTVSLETVAESVGTLPNVSWLAVGRENPGALGEATPAATVQVEEYQSRALVDVLSTRASHGLRRGLAHELTNRVAGWAEGDAHDALAAVFGAADAALAAGRSSLVDGDVQEGIDDVPRDGVPTARVLALPENRKRVLDGLLALDAASMTLRDAASAVAQRTDLSETTVTRYLYELADEAVLDRVPIKQETTGRDASRVVPRFPARVYRRLRGDNMSRNM